MKTRPDFVYIVVLNWNNAADTIQCLESVFNSTYDRYQVVLCDNASTDGSLEVITAWLTRRGITLKSFSENELSGIAQPVSSQVVVIRNQKNYGYAGGNNRGLRYAQATGSAGFAWIINNDVEVDSTALTSLVAAAKSRPAVGLFGSTILDYVQRDEIQTQGGDQYYHWLAMSSHIGAGRHPDSSLSQEEVEKRLSYIVGASVFVRLSTIKKIGLMFEGYFLYFEELDWATQALRRGIGLGYVADSLIYHKEGGTIGSSARSRQKSWSADYYGVKNRLQATRRLFPWALPTVWLGLLITLIKRLASGQWDRAVMVLQIMTGTDRPPPPPS